MTVICAAKGPDGIWIGSDTQCELDGNVLPTAPKWLVVDAGLAIGVSGKATMRQLLRVNLADIAASRDAWKIGRAWRKAAQDDGFSGEEQDGRRVWEVRALMVLDGVFYGMDSAFDFDSHDAPYIASGSGMDFALGAAYALPDASARERVFSGIRAACHHSRSCGGEPWVHKLA